VNHHDRDGAVSRQLEAMGIDSRKLSELGRFHIRANIVVGFVVSALFALFGVMGILVNLIAGSISGTLFCAVFAGVGIYGWRATRLLLRAMSNVRWCGG